MNRTDFLEGEGPSRLDVERNNVEVIRAFLGQGGDPNFDDGKLLRSAASQNNVTILTLLLSYGADPNIEDTDALHLAAMSGAADAVALLCDAGANIHSAEGRAIDWAAFSGDVKTIETLLGRGADPAQIKNPKPAALAAIQAYRLKHYHDTPEASPKPTIGL